MKEDLLQQFEAAIRRRNPRLVERFRPGLSEDRIWRMLQRKRIAGAVEPLVSLFHWKDGTSPDPNITLEQSSPFPDSAYTFMDLEMMIADFQAFKTFAV